MAMKNIQGLINANVSDPYKTADTTNHAGGKAWTMPDEQRLMQIMHTGVFGHAYYADQKTLIDEAIKFLARMAKEQPQMVADQCVSGRNKGYIRTAPILGLCLLSTTDTERFKMIFNDVIKTGNDMEDFIGMTRSIGRGFGSAVKKAMRGWLQKNVSSFYAMKYTRQLADAIRLSRPKSDDSIYDYIMRMAKGEKSFEEYCQKHGKVSRFSEALETYPQLKAYEEAKVCLRNNDWKTAISLITNAKLDPMALLGEGNPPKDVWQALSEQMGVMMYLKYINKMLREDAFDSGTMESKLTVKNLKAAKVFPFRLYTAYKHIQGGPDATKVKNHLADVLNDYVTEYDWGKWDKRIVIAPDISGSMTSGSGQLAPCVVAGMLSGILYKGVKKSMVLPWNTQLHPSMMGPRADSVLTHIERVERASGGGTYMELPVDYMIQNKVQCDLFILITDSMEWGSGWLSKWKEYRKRVCPTAKAVLIRVDAYRTNPYPEDQAHELGIYEVFGWNDNVLSFIEQCVL